MCCIHMCAHVGVHMGRPEHVTWLLCSFSALFPWHEVSQWTRNWLLLLKANKAQQFLLHPRHPVLGLWAHVATFTSLFVCWVSKLKSLCLHRSTLNHWTVSPHPRVGLYFTWRPLGNIWDPNYSRAYVAILVLLWDMQTLSDLPVVIKLTMERDNIESVL